MKIKIALILIVILAAVLRVYKIDSVPASLSWDEAAVGVNAWTIANWGRDEYGKIFPAYFTSFGDDKHPVHVYSTAVSVKILGLSEFSTRIPSAVFGILNVILIFFLVRLMFLSTGLALASSFFLAVSPYSIHFSRFNHEANFALFFFMLALFFFFTAVKRNINFLPLSVIAFAITFITYHPAKVVVPAVGLVLSLFYHKEIFKKRFNIILSLIILIIFSVFLFLNPQLLGRARINQTSVGKEDIAKTPIFKMTDNEMLGRFNLTLIQYSWHFKPDYLFLSGDKNPRLSDQKTGQFYSTDALFLLAGIIFLLRKRTKPGLLILAWALIAPLPSALTAEAPHGARAMYMMGSWNIISAFGLIWLISFVRKPLFKTAALVSAVGLTALFLVFYLRHYYGEYAIKNAIDWQYGARQIVQYAKDHPEYSQVFTSPVRGQPYIFFLYYLKMPLADYLNTVIYNNSEDKSYNLIATFDRYFFTGFKAIESDAQRGVLYALSPSEYDGLRFRSMFDIKKIIYYPNGTTAYFLVSLK